MSDIRSDELFLGVNGKLRSLHSVVGGWIRVIRIARGEAYGGS